jgi:hypothetical protein
VFYIAESERQVNSLPLITYFVQKYYHWVE